MAPEASEYRRVRGEERDERRRGDRRTVTKKLFHIQRGSGWSATIERRA